MKHRRKRNRLNIARAYGGRLEPRQLLAGLSFDTISLQPLEDLETSTPTIQHCNVESTGEANREADPPAEECCSECSTEVTNNFRTNGEFTASSVGGNDQDTPFRPSTFDQETMITTPVHAPPPAAENAPQNNVDVPTAKIEQGIYFQNLNSEQSRLEESPADSQPANLADANGFLPDLQTPQLLALISPASATAKSFGAFKTNTDTSQPTALGYFSLTESRPGNEFGAANHQPNASRFDFGSYNDELNNDLRDELRTRRLDAAFERLIQRNENSTLLEAPIQNQRSLESNDNRTSQLPAPIFHVDSDTKRQSSVAVQPKDPDSTDQPGQIVKSAAILIAVRDLHNRNKEQTGPASR